MNVTKEDIERIKERANEAKKAYVVAMAAFKANPPKILKDKNVNYPTSKGTTDYHHATLGNVTTCINTTLSEHGLTASWVTSQDNGAVKVTCKITHIMGHSEETSLTAPPDSTGSKNAIQAIGSTVTYLQRYTLLALTGLATYEDDDGAGADKKDADLPEGPNPAEQKIIKKICAILQVKVGKDKTISEKLVASTFLTKGSEYPNNPDMVEQAAQWLIDNTDEREGAIEETKPKTNGVKIMGQVWFELETIHKALLDEGEVKLDRKLFEKAYKKLSDPIKFDAPSKIAIAIRLKDITVNVKDGVK